MGGMPNISWKVMPIRSGHHYIPEMKVSKPKIAALSSKSASFFQHSIEKKSVTLVRSQLTNTNNKGRKVSCFTGQPIMRRGLKVYLDNNPSRPVPKPTTFFCS